MPRRQPLLGCDRTSAKADGEGGSLSVGWLHGCKSSTICIPYKLGVRVCAHARAGYWRRDGPLGQNPCQKVEEIVNGWKRASGTMHTQTCMVPLVEVHGWTSQLAWFRSPKCMVGLPEVHGSASGVAWLDLKTAIYRPKMTRPHARPAHHRAASPPMP